LITGTIWAPNHNPVTNPAGGQEGTQTVFAGITTISGYVAGNGLLGTIYVDTTGWTLANEPLLNGVGPGKGWELNMGGGQGVWDTPNSPPNTMPTLTDFPPFEDVPDGSLSIIDGHISIIPEPSSLALAMIAVVGLMIARLRRR
jgi:hypothetical protein